MTMGIYFVLAGIFVAVLAATAALRAWLVRRAFLDIPNERSSHTVPTPRGGGIAIVAVGFAAIWTTSHLPLVILVCGILLAVLSWFDDIKSLPALPRFMAQILTVATAIVTVLPTSAVFQFPISPTIAAIAIGLVWVWFINLYNFMDGIDGISGVETMSICFGIALIASQTDGANHLVMPSLIIATATAGFLWWNWHPAKIFLGDVGSVPIGFITGYLLLELAAAGQPEAALLLPGYYLADATITLIRRALRCEKVWRAHKEHFYQRAHQRGLSHSDISLRVTFINVVLVGAALTATLGHPILAIAVGFGAVTIFLLHLQGPRSLGSEKK